jgi:pimeloyl-ACP methyl ester carboxylesterase
MDVSASFQFLVDALTRNYRILAPDWRGFGLTDRPQADCYWFPDYMGDLEALLDQCLPGEAVDLVAHSMGGNVAMLYAGVRPQRVRRLINLDGVGMPASRPENAPARYAEWLDELREGARLRDYASREEVAERLCRNNPRLSAARAAFLAQHWSAPNAAGRFELLGDPAHKLVNPQLYRVEEAVACWRAITAPVMLVFAGEAGRWQKFVSSGSFRIRLSAIRHLRTEKVADAGHMLHHDQPERVAALIEDFLA